MGNYKLKHPSQICTKRIHVNTNPILMPQMEYMKNLKLIEEQEKVDNKIFKSNWNENMASLNLVNIYNVSH